MRCVPALRASVLVLGLAAACTLRARWHPCYPFLADRYHGRIPSEIMGVLAHDSGARRTVRHHRAPTGFYWRRAQPGTANVESIRTLADGHELAVCPGNPAGAATRR